MFPPPYSASPPPCRSLWLGFLLLHQRVSAGLLSLRGCAGVPEPEVEDSTSAIVVKNLMERYDGKEDGAFLSRQSSVFIQVPPPPSCPSCSDTAVTHRPLTTRFARRLVQCS